MKKILLLLMLTVALVSCKDDCTQPAIATLIQTANSSYQLNAEGDTMVICHYDAVADSYFTITISTSALESHLAHGDSEGECQSLSDGGLRFEDGVVQEIDCSYELPFMHIKDNGEQWFFTSPN